MIRFVVFLFLSFFPILLVAQPIVVESNNKIAIPTLTQEQIDAIEPGSDGYVVFNLTSGCLNYFYGENWFEVCGTCSPKATLPKIDSIVQENSLLHVFFESVHHEEIKARIVNKDQTWLSATESPLTLNVPPNVSTVSLQIQSHNSCGAIDTTLKVSLKTRTISPLILVKIDGKDIITRKIGQTQWMCQDYVHPSIKPTLKEQPTFISPYNNKNVCPSGWQLPSQKDWETLLSSFTNNNEQLFFSPKDENESIHLRSNGIYSIQEKTFFGTEAAYYWVQGKNEDKQQLVSISKNGSIFLSEKSELALIPIRCIKHD